MMSQYIALVFCIIYFTLSIYLCRNLKIQVGDLTFGGITCAMTIVLSYMMVPLPTGATISVGYTIPIILLALLRDYRLAIICGWISGIMCLFLVPAWQPVHWAQIFVEHLVCFSCLGYVSVFGKDKKYKVWLGIASAFLIKLFGHILSGVLFFTSNAWDGWGAWGYSLAYNVSSIIPEEIITIIILICIPINILRQQKNYNQEKHYENDRNAS